MNFLILICLGCVSVVQVAAQAAGQVAVQSCMNVPTKALNYEELVTLSPFRVRFTINAAFNCTSAIYTNNANSSSSYTGTATYIDGTGQSTSYDITMSQNSQSCNITSCVTGVPTFHRFLNTDFSSNVGMCVFVCTGDAVSDIRCYARNGFTQANLQSALSLFNGVSGAPAPTSSMVTCDAGDTCQWF